MLAFAEDTWSWMQFAKIALLDILLAGDNAVIIALAVRFLPPREQTLGRLWGTAGAVALRVLFLAIATWLLAIPWVQFGGGLLLVWIAWKLLAPQAPHVESGDDTTAVGPAAKVRAASSLRESIRIIVIADASMSLDNVIAVSGAAEGHLGLAAGGIALSIPLVIWGSQILGKLMVAHPWIVWCGGGVLGHVAGVLMLEERQIVAWLGKCEHPGWHPLAIGLGVFFAAYGWWASRAAKR